MALGATTATTGTARLPGQLDLRSTPPVWAIAVAGTLCVCVGAAASLGAAGAFIVLALLALAGIIASTLFRVLFLVFGGILVFQSSAEVSMLKMAFIAGVAVAATVSFVRVLGRKDSTMTQASHLLAASAVLGVYFLATGAWAILGGTPPLDWLRDVAPYLLLAISPVIAIDASNDLDRTQVTWILFGAGLLSAIGFFFTWSLRRGFSETALSYTAMGSLTLAGAAVALAVALVVSGRLKHRFALAALAVAITALFFATGTRTSIAFIVIPLVAILMTGGRATLHRLLLLAGGLALAAAMVLAATTLVTSFTQTNQDAAIERLKKIPYVSSSPGANQSVDARRIQNQLAFRTAMAHPVAGIGPGHKYFFDPGYGEGYETFSLDSSVGFLAKFGLIGVAIMLAWIWALARFIRQLRGRGATVEFVAFSSFLAFVVVLMLPMAALEEKGFSSSIFLLLALSILQADRTTQQQQLSA